MSLRTHCDGCEVISVEPHPQWLKLFRANGVINFAAMMSGSTSDGDPVLGHGLTFHSYDCLRVWLMAHQEVAR